MQYICSLRTQAAVENRLGSLPSELGKIYEEIYTMEIEVLVTEDRIVAESILHFLMCIQQALDATSFLVILSAGLKIDPLNVLQALDLTANLVVYDEQFDVLRFAHVSVREFLEKDREEYRETSNHRVVATACLRVLMDSHIPIDLFGPTTVVTPPRYMISNIAQTKKPALSDLFADLSVSRLIHGNLHGVTAFKQAGMMLVHCQFFCLRRRLSFGRRGDLVKFRHIERQLGRISII